MIERFDQPDVIYTDIYQFWHSGVAPWRPEPHLLDVRHGFFFAGRDQPFKLSREEAVRAVTGSLRLRMNFSFNSQAFLYSRRIHRKAQAARPGLPLAVPRLLQRQCGTGEIALHGRCAAAPRGGRRVEGFLWLRHVQ